MGLTARKLDRRSVVTQVRDDLRNRIVQGELRTGDQLPGEVEGADVFGVSRATIREAYKLLEQEGIIVVRRGHGRYVSPHAQRQLIGAITLFRSMTEFLESKGYAVGTRVLSVITRRATEAECAALALDPEVPVVDVERIRLGDGVPLVYGHAVFAARLVQGAADALDWSGSVMAFMRSRGLRPASATLDVSAANLPDAIAAATGLDACRAWLCLSGVQFDAAGEPFLFTSEYIRGDVRTLHIVQRTEQ